MRPLVTVRVALATAAGAWLVALAAQDVGARTFDPAAAALLRTVLVTGVLTGVTWFLLRGRLLDTPRTTLRASAGLGLVAGYAVLPTAWQGRAYAGELLDAHGAAATALDLAAWLVVGGLTAWCVTRPAAAAHVPVTYASPR